MLTETTATEVDRRDRVAVRTVAVRAIRPENPAAIFDAVDHLRGRGNDLICFHLLDRDELDFPFTDAGSFIDAETGDKLPLVPDYLRKEYKRLVQEHTAQLSRLATERRMDYALFDTSRPIADALYAYLGARERFNRVR